MGKSRLEICGRAWCRWGKVGGIVRGKSFAIFCFFIYLGSRIWAEHPSVTRRVTSVQTSSASPSKPVAMKTLIYPYVRNNNSVRARNTYQPRTRAQASKDDLQDSFLSRTEEKSWGPSGFLGSSWLGPSPRLQTRWTCWRQCKETILGEDNENSFQQSSFRRGRRLVRWFRDRRERQLAHVDEAFQDLLSVDSTSHALSCSIWRWG